MKHSCNATEQCFEDNEAKQRFEKWSHSSLRNTIKCSNQNHARGARLPKVTMLIRISTNGYIEETKRKTNNPAYKRSH